MKTVKLNLDGKLPQYVVPDDLYQLYIDAGGRQERDLAAEPYSFAMHQSYEPGPLDWGQLVQLKRLGHIYYKGDDIGVLDYLSRPDCSVIEFRWNGHGQKHLDFSRSHKLHTLIVEVPYKAFRLTLPEREGLRSLRLLSPPAGCRLTVNAPNQGNGLNVYIGGSDVLRIPGLKGIEGLAIFSATTVDLHFLGRAYPQLESLHISGRSVTLTGIAALARLKSLKKMWFTNCFAMHVAEFPGRDELPLLEDVSFNGLRVEDASILKKKYKGVKWLHIVGKRNAEWIENNLDNPFRNWDEEFGRAAGNKAMKAWATARTELKKLDTPDAAEGSAILKAFVEVFNQMERRSGFETDQRETIYDAFTELASRLPTGSVTDDDYYEWAEYS